MQRPVEPFAQSRLAKSDQRVVLETMRKRLAGSSQVAAQQQLARKARTQRSRSAMVGQGALALLVLACNGWLAYENRHDISRFIQQHALPLLAPPSASLGPDAEALYWTYALYDFPKLQELYSVESALAIDHNRASRRLKELLPKVQQSTIAEISLYVAPGGPR